MADVVAHLEAGGSIYPYRDEICDLCRNGHVHIVRQVFNVLEKREDFHEALAAILMVAARDSELDTQRAFVGVMKILCDTHALYAP